jgi:predicted dehydrogenase
MLSGGMIGCGFFAINHLNAWKMLSGARVAALCDSDEARLEAAGSAFGIDTL